MSAGRSPSEAELARIVESVVAEAGPGEQIDAMAAKGHSTQIKVYGGEVESFTSAETSGIGVRIIAGGRVGFAHAGSLDPSVIEDVVAQARDNLPFSEVDPWVGLAEPDGVEPVLHDQWNPELADLPAARKIEVATELEARALGTDPRVRSVRTAVWTDSAGAVAYASSGGLSYTDRATSCGISCQPIARDGEETQIGYASDAARSVASLDVDRVVTESVERATRLLGATKPPTSRVTLLLEPRLAGTLLGVVTTMLDGEAVLKGRSPFAERVGETIASPHLTILDDPTRGESLGADSWDGEGLACRPTPLIEAGVLCGFLHNSYTARRSGTASTASAVRSARSLPGVGARVLVMAPGRRSDEELCGSIELGLAVESFVGLHSGINPVSGDFSVGATGVMIRNGERAEPVREVTVASTLQRLLLDIVEVGADADWYPSGDYLASMVIGDVIMSGT